MCVVQQNGRGGPNNEPNPEILHGGAAKVVGQVDAGRFRTLEDAVLHLRLDAILLGGRRDSLESSFEGKTDHDAMREMRADSSGGGGEGLKFQGGVLAQQCMLSSFGRGFNFGRKRDFGGLSVLRAAESTSVWDARQRGAVRQLQNAAAPARRNDSCSERHSVR
jgi:hypothetical protein